MIKQSVLVTGSNGQLGNELQILANEYSNLTFLFKDLDLNITDYEALDGFFATNKIDWVINCAAYTAVDKAEEENEKAWLINAEGPKNLAKVSANIMLGSSILALIMSLVVKRGYLIVKTTKYRQTLSTENQN